MKYITLNSDGSPSSLLSDKIHVIPKEALKITEDQWREIHESPRPVKISKSKDGTIIITRVEASITSVATCKRREIESAYNSALREGLPYTMPDGSNDVIQTRPEDEANLLGLAIEARDLKADGVTDAVQALRAQSNTLYEMTPTQMIEATDAAKAFKKDLLKRSWERKGEIDAALDAEDREALNAIDW